MKGFAFFFFFIFLLGSISSACSEGQININNASLEELDKIIYVGNATAIKIVGARPFSSVDDLIRVKGIGNITLGKIKAEGLACVYEKEEEKISPIEEKPEPEEIVTETITPSENLTEEIKELQVIKLNSKDIKNDNSTQESKEESFTKKYAGFGLVALGMLILGLLFLQKRNTKNELE